MLPNSGIVQLNMLPNGGEKILLFHATKRWYIWLHEGEIILTGGTLHYD